MIVAQASCPRRLAGNVMKWCFVALVLMLSFGSTRAEAPSQPVTYAIFGLEHDHANGFIPRARDRPEVQLAGIIEPNQELVSRYARLLNLPTNLFAASLEELLGRTNIQAVAAFTSTFEHRHVVEMCAPRGIHVMMEKPLAVSLEDARAIETAAKKGGIQVIVNYETTWYPANQNAYTILHDQHAIGDVRKMVAHDGHRGPQEIGCSQAFLKWLTDPVLNGGGAMTDFGCYGADLMTWLMEGQRPTSVTAVTQQVKPQVYPKVEDEATIILTYPQAQGIIQASWNWPFDRKDLELYGRTGYLMAPQRDLLRLRKSGSEESELKLHAPPVPGPSTDEIAYLAAVVRGETRPSGPSSLDVNLVVTEILDAARLSAQTGKRIDLPRDPPW
jgi:predicted dehydrogenase